MPHPRGAAMLISVLVLSAILTSFAIVTSTLAHSELSVLTAFQNKIRAKALAESCIERALDTFGRNAGYGGNETIIIGANSCFIEPIAGAAAPWTITASAVINQQTIRMRTVISSRAPVVIESWTEVGL